MSNDLAHDVRQGLAGKIAIFAQRAPLGAGVARGTCATKTVSSSGKCVNTWRDDARQLAPFRFQPSGAACERVHRDRNHAPSRCPALRSWSRAGLFPGAGAAARGRRRAAPRRPRRGAICLRALAPCAEIPPDGRARAPRKPRSTGTARRPAAWASRWWRRDPSSACAKSPARRGGNSDAASRLMVGLAAGNASSTANSRDTTRSTLPSTGTAGGIEGDRRHRRRGVVADARQRAQGFDAFGKNPAVALDHRAGAGMQVAGAGVIAEPGPGAQHVVELGLRPARSTVGQRARKRA